jgi:hypothetical protein
VVYKAIRKIKIAKTMLKLNAYRFLQICLCFIGLNPTFAQNVCNPTVIIDAPKQEICLGDHLKITATTTNEGLSPSFQWYLDDELVGGDSSEFTYKPTYNDGGKFIKVVLSSSAACKSADKTSSNILSIKTNSVPNLSVEIYPPYFCHEQNNTFEMKFASYDPAVTYTWFANGNKLEYNNNESTLNVYAQQFTDGNHFYIEATTTSACATINSYKSNTSIFSTATCIENKGETFFNPVSIGYNQTVLDDISNYSIGRSGYNLCNTDLANENVIDAFYQFVASSENTTLELNSSNSNFAFAVALGDPDYSEQYVINCQKSNGLHDEKRYFNFTGLTVGHSYILRVEIGEVNLSLPKRAAMNTNAFSVNLIKTIDGITETNNTQQKTISSIINLQGQVVDVNYQGLVIYKYIDGTTLKVIQ